MFVFLIGHGTFDGKVAKFNLPGPDMTPADFEPLLKRLKSQHVVLVNTSSASGPFVETLAAPGRTIVAATRNGAERFATLFGGYFVDALAGVEADTDKNGRTSVLEAFAFAKREVGVAYEREGIMLTEHPILSDNGEKTGTQTPTADGKQGRVASVIVDGRGVVRGIAACRSEAARAVCRAARAGAADRRAEAAEGQHGGRAQYASELERLATELALQDAADSRERRQAAVKIGGCALALAGLRAGGRCRGRRRLRAGPQPPAAAARTRCRATRRTTGGSCSSGCATTCRVRRRVRPARRTVVARLSGR